MMGLGLIHVSKMGYKTYNATNDKTKSNLPVSAWVIGQTPTAANS